MSDLTVNILDGQLGLVNAAGDQVIAHLGVCALGTPNSVNSFGDINTASSTLGPGTLTENVADTISVAGSCMAVPVTPSVAGSVGSTTHVGTGAGTVTGSAKPVYQILAKITTGGALGTMAVSFSVNGGAYSNPYTSTVSTYSKLVPGTLTTLTFADQTYTLNDVWTITTAGVITVSGSGTAGWVTQASSPIDTYDVIVTIVTGGALGTATFTYSMDGGNSQSAIIATPSGGTYVIAGTGVMLTFASTFVAADTYEFTTVTAGFGTSDVAAALTALGADARLWFGFHVAGMGSSSAAAASMCSTCDTSLTAFQTAFRYVMGIVECPQTEGDSTIIAAFANFASNRVMVTVTDILHSSSLNRGRTLRRNIGVAIASRLAAINPSQDPGWVGSPLGALANVTRIYRNEAATPGLATNRFTVGTTRPTKNGYFCATGNMMAQAGSDFSSVGNRRVMDIACQTAVGVFINDLNADLLTNPGDGTIFDPEASRLEGAVKNALENRLLSPTPPDAVAVDAQINRSNNVLSTQNLQLTVKVVPKAKARTLTMTIGFSL
jgi:hypothetical protein